MGLGVLVCDHNQHVFRNGNNILPFDEEIVLHTYHAYDDRIGDWFPVRIVAISPHTCRRF